MKGFFLKRKNKLFIFEAIWFCLKETFGTQLERWLGGEIVQDHAHPG